MSWCVHSSSALESGRDFKQCLCRSFRFFQGWPGRWWELAPVFGRGCGGEAGWGEPLSSSTAGQRGGLFQVRDWLGHTLQLANTMITTSCSMVKPCFGCWPHRSLFAKWWSCSRVKISVSVLRATAFQFSGKAFEFTVWLWLFCCSGITHSH